MPSYFFDGPSQDFTKVAFESGDDPRFKSAQDILTGSFESLYSLSLAPNHMSKKYVKEHLRFWMTSWYLTLGWFHM